MYEAQLLRKQLLLPGDIKSKVINNICDFFITPTDEIVHKLAMKQKLLIRKTLPQKVVANTMVEISKAILGANSQEEVAKQKKLRK